MARELKERQKNSALYLYAVTRPPAGVVPDIRGVDGEADIEPMECAGLVCWISRVPATDFAENLSRNMENLDWLAGASVRHQQAVEAIASSRDLLPARFGTVFLSESSLGADIRKRKKDLAKDFQRVSGAEEWGIKIFAAPAQARLPERVRSGKEYLQAKSDLLRMQKPVGPDEEVKRFAKEVEQLAIMTSPGGKISGGRRDLQYHASILVKRSDRKKLQDLLRRYSKQWKDTRKIECSGPWPPYSFVTRASEAASE